MKLIIKIEDNNGDTKNMFISEIPNSIEGLQSSMFLGQVKDTIETFEKLSNTCCETNCETKNTEEVKRNPKVEVKVTPGNPLKEHKKLRVLQPDEKAFSMYSCPECGALHTKIVNGYIDSETCYKCGVTFSMPPLIKVDYCCPNCGTRGFINVQEGISEVRCKSCESPIDIVFVEKKGQFFSSNMVRGELK